MSDIDWSKAPEWATRLMESVDGVTPNCWADNHVRGLWVTDPPQLSFRMMPHRWILIERRPAPQWNGEGLPPVGLECAISHVLADQGTGYIKFYGDEFCVIQNTTKGLEREQNGRICDYRFSPIGTPEQLAAERRALAVNRAAEFIPSSQVSGRTIAEILYDNGLLKGSDEA